MATMKVLSRPMRKRLKKRPLTMLASRRTPAEVKTVRSQRKRRSPVVRAMREQLRTVICSGEGVCVGHEDAVVFCLAIEPSCKLSRTSVPNVAKRVQIKFDESIYCLRHSVRRLARGNIYILCVGLAVWQQRGF